MDRRMTKEAAQACFGREFRKGENIEGGRMGACRGDSPTESLGYAGDIMAVFKAGVDKARAGPHMGERCWDGGKGSVSRLGASILWDKRVV